MSFIVGGRDGLPFSQTVNSFNQDECEICLEMYQEQDTVVELACKHIFHQPCAIKGFKGSGWRCAKCRHPVEVDDSMVNICNVFMRRSPAKIAITALMGMVILSCYLFTHRSS